MDQPEDRHELTKTFRMLRAAERQENIAKLWQAHEELLSNYVSSLFMFSRAILARRNPMLDEKTLCEFVDRFAHLGEAARAESIAQLNQLMKRFMDVDAQSKPPPEPKVDESEVAWQESVVAMLQGANLLEESAELVEKTRSVDSTRMASLMRDYVALTRTIAQHFAKCPLARAEFEVEWRNAHVQKSVPG